MRAHAFRVLSILALMAGVLHLCGCGSESINAEQGAQRKIFLIGNKSEPGTMDVQLINSVGEHQIQLALSEGLLAEHPERDDDVEPGVAERWESNDAKSEWIFHLRKEAKWSDGHAMTAHDWVWSWQRMVNKALAAKYAEMLFLVKNGRQVNTGELPPEALGVKARGAHTLVVTLEGPTPHFPLVVCHTSWWATPRHVIEKHGSPFDHMNPWTEDAHFVGNGPFKLKRYLFKQYVEVERNPHYWDHAKVALAGVRFYPIESDTTEDRLFRRGQLHVTYTTPLPKVPSYAEKYPGIYQAYPILSVRFFRVNTTRKPFDDARVRLAFGMALDRESIVKNVMRGGQLAATGLVPPMVGYRSGQLVKFDPTAAAAMLAEAGFPGGKGFPEGVKILVSKFEADVQLAEAVQDMWKRHLGVSVAITQQDFSVMQKSQAQLNYDIGILGWGADYFDPCTFIDMWTTGNGNNNTGWSDVTFDGVVDEATQCADAKQRLEILQRAEARVVGSGIVLPIYFYTRNRLIHPAVPQWKRRALDNVLWKHLDLAWPPPPERAALMMP